MNAAEALRSIGEDIDRLEAKNLARLKPGFFRRRRDEVDAIAAELKELARQVASAELERDEARHQLHAEELRVGILANTITILGFDMRPHMAVPVEDADVYHDAAAMVSNARKNAPGGPNRLSTITPRSILRETLAKSLWWARLNRFPLSQLIEQFNAKKQQGNRAA